MQYTRPFDTLTYEINDYTTISGINSKHLRIYNLILVDWLIVDMVAARFGCIGRIRYILKDELKFIPLYGLYFRQVIHCY